MPTSTTRNGVSLFRRGRKHIPRLELLLIILSVPCFFLISLWSLHIQLPHEFDYNSQPRAHQYPGMPAHGPYRTSDWSFASSLNKIYNNNPKKETRDDADTLGDDHYANRPPRDMSAASFAETGGETFQEYANKWWWKNGHQDAPPEMFSRILHPDFRRSINDARDKLEEKAELRRRNKRKGDDDRVSLPKWKPAPSPPNQTITFHPFALPDIPNLQSNTDEEEAMDQVVVLVLSTHRNFDRRQAIRQTWGRQNHTGHTSTPWRLFFVIGQSECDEYDQDIDKDLPIEELERRNRRQRLLQAQSDNQTLSEKARPHCVEEDHDFLWEEQLEYQDLLEIPMAESYRRLPEKVLQAYHWALESLPSQVGWFVKADDDAFVRIATLSRYLQKYNSHIPMWIGKMIPHSKVRRKGKWAEHTYVESNYYPYWAIGSAGHILSRAAAEYLVQHSQDLYRYQGEDVSIGIWLDQAFKRGDLPRLTYIQAKSMINNGGVGYCGTDNYMIIGHDLTVEEIYECSVRFSQPVPENVAPLDEERVWMDEPANFPALIEEQMQHQEEQAAHRQKDDEDFSPNGNGHKDDSSYYLKNLPKGRSTGRVHPAHLRSHLQETPVNSRNKTSS